MSSENNASTPLGLAKSLFWDVDPHALDPERSARLIISRVVELGKLEDWHRVRRHYGTQRMIEVVTELREVRPQAVSLCCAAFDLTPTDFRCFSAKPFPMAPWIS